MKGESSCGYPIHLHAASWSSLLSNRATIAHCQCTGYQRQTLCMWKQIMWTSIYWLYEGEGALGQSPIKQKAASRRNCSTLAEEIVNSRSGAVTIPIIIMQSKWTNSELKARGRYRAPVSWQPLPVILWWGRCHMDNPGKWAPLCSWTRWTAQCRPN